MRADLFHEVECLPCRIPALLLPNQGPVMSGWVGVIGFSLSDKVDRSLCWEHSYTHVRVFGCAWTVPGTGLESSGYCHDTNPVQHQHSRRAG